VSWGDCYFDHFGRYFRAPVAREVFAQASDEPDPPTIQILSYDNVFEGCRLFASLGLTHYAETVGEVAEIIVLADDAWEQIPGLMANVLFYMVQERMRIGWGMAIARLDNVDGAFTRRFGKSALYITRPFGLPKGAEEVTCGGQRGSVYLGVFLEEAEYRLLLDHGAERLEAVLEASAVDPYHLTRASVV
jgi:hypothetical protein